MKLGPFKTSLHLFCVCFFLLLIGGQAVAAGINEIGLPIGEMIAKGNVSVEVKPDRWRQVETSNFPVFIGVKIRTEKGTAVIALANNCQMEMGPNSSLSFVQRDQISLLQGSVHFRIPPTVHTKFSVGTLSIIKSPQLHAYANPAPIFPRMEESIGSLSFRANGSVFIKSDRGSLSVLDQDRNVLASLPSKESTSLLPSKGSGNGRIMVAQAGGPLPHVQKMQDELKTVYGLDSRDVDDLEEYLIDFSQALKGKNLPPDLDAEKFFSFLEQYYPDQEAINHVKEYSVKAENVNESYVLTICDRQNKWKLYRDYGQTTDEVDFPYWPDGERVECREPLVPPAAVAVWFGEGYATAIFALIDQDKDKEDKKPICP